MNQNLENIKSKVSSTIQRLTPIHKKIIVVVIIVVMVVVIFTLVTKYQNRQLLKKALKNE